MIEIFRTDSTNTYFKNLVARLDMELHKRYGQLQNNYDKHNIIESCDTVVIVKENNNFIGCGCFKKYNKDTVEIKRMYVDTKYRGFGISKIILGELETWAKELGYKYTILETGIKQPEAIGLYKKCGYQTIDNFGQYKGMDVSVCMKKQISN
jgi:GNAT superfamily N-acetyltransferase